MENYIGRFDGSLRARRVAAEPDIQGVQRQKLPELQARGSTDWSRRSSSAVSSRIASRRGLVETRSIASSRALALTERIGPFASIRPSTRSE